MQKTDSPTRPVRPRRPPPAIRRVATAVLATVLASVAGVVAAAPSRAIVGGSTAGNFQFPYLVELTAPAAGGLCTATLIHPSWILTAQHCATVAQPSDLQVRIGNVTAGTGGEVIPITKIVLDPAYDAQVDDVALLHLQWPSAHRPVKLADPSQLSMWDGLGADVGVAAGWGLTSSGGSLPSTLQYAPVRIAPDGTDPRGDRKITLDAAANGAAPVRGTCQGDSGGPLLVTLRDGSRRIAGVVKAADCLGGGWYSEVGAGPTNTWIRSQVPDEYADTVYGIQPNGDMLCYRHLGYSDGAPRWLPPKTVGTGWNSFRTVFTGSGAIYGLATDGRVFYYRHNAYDRCGVSASDWTFPGGKVVASGWSNVVTAFGMPGTAAGTGGIVYTIDTAGNLRWWRHNGWASGSASWSGGNVVGTGWNGLVKVFPGQNGEIYGINAAGDLREYIHYGWQDGTVRWGSINVVGVGWSGYSKVFSGGGGGVIYGVRASTHELIWFRHTGHSFGTRSWEGPFTVGTSWGSFATLLVHSFAPPAH